MKSRTRIGVLISVALVASLGAHPGATTSTGTAEVFEVEPVRAERRASELGETPGSSGQTREIPKTREDTDGPSRTSAEGGPDPLLDEQEGAAGRALSTPSLNFDGHANTGVVPSDVVGDVGPNHYVQMVNASAGASVAIFNKSDGSPALPPFLLDSLGTNNCANGRGDPIPLYDHFASRWLLTEFTATGNTMCLYVSSTSNPVTSTWTNYALVAPNFPDYPKWAVWRGSYLIGTNEPGGSPVYALDRAEVLAGVAASAVRLNGTDLGGFGFQLLTPADIDGPNAPPAGSPGIFVRHNDDESHTPTTADPTKDFIEIWELNVNWANPGAATLARTQSVPVSEFDSDLCGLVSFECFDQPGGGGDLDPLREPVMWRPVYRSFGGQQALVGSFVTDVTGTDQGGVRWFELRRASTTTTGGWTLRQEGTFAPDAVTRWMSSIAIDKAGGIALGYNVVSDTLNVPAGIRYTGRLVNDPLGAMTATEQTIIAGTGTQAHFRWGDYSSMNIDPIDDCTFWYTNNYVGSTNVWKTRIASFVYPECLSSTPAKPSLRVSDVRLLEGDPTNTTSLKAFRFRVTASAAAAGMSVRFRTADRTAQAGSDYLARNVLVRFGPAQRSKVVTVQVRRDRLREPNERFLVRLSAPTNATIADRTGVGTIVNDD